MDQGFAPSRPLLLSVSFAFDLNIGSRSPGYPKAIGFSDEKSTNSVNYFKNMSKILLKINLL